MTTWPGALGPTAGGTTLSPNDCTHAHSADNAIIISGQHILVIQSATHALSDVGSGVNQDFDPGNYACSDSPVSDLGDNFTDTDGTLLSAHTSDTGGIWTISTNEPDIYGNGVRFPATSGCGAWRNVNFANQEIRFQWSPISLTNDFAIWFRRDNSSGVYPYKGYRFECDVVNGFLTLQRVDDQWRSTQSLASPVAFSFSPTPYNGKIVIDENDAISIYFDQGTAEATTARFGGGSPQLVDSTYSGQTHVGFEGKTAANYQRLWWICARNLNPPTITGTATGGISSAFVYLSAAPIREEVSVDTNTLAAPYKLAVGDFRVPIGRSYSTITSVFVSFTGSTDYSQWSYQVVDKQNTGPRIKLYNTAASPMLADATVDVHIRGY